jgi:hypothetical protein
MTVSPGRDGSPVKSVPGVGGRKRSNPLHKVSLTIVGSLERFFYK